MTPRELSAALRVLGWSGAQLAAQLGCSRKSVWTWLNDVADVPGAVAVWLRALTAAHQACPSPRPADWRSRHSLKAWQARVPQTAARRSAS